MAEAKEINAVIESIVASIGALKEENARLRSLSLDGAELKSMQLSLEKKEHEFRQMQERFDVVQKENERLKRENEHYLARINQFATLLAKESSSEGTTPLGKSLSSESLLSPKNETLRVASPSPVKPPGEPEKNLFEETQAAQKPKEKHPNPFDGQDSDDPFIEGGDLDDDEFFKNIGR